MILEMVTLRVDQQSLSGTLPVAWLPAGKTPALPRLPAGKTPALPRLPAGKTPALPRLPAGKTPALPGYAGCAAFQRSRNIPGRPWVALAGMHPIGQDLVSLKHSAIRAEVSALRLSVEVERCNGRTTRRLMRGKRNVEN